MKKDYHNRLLLMHPIPLQQLCGQCVNSHATALLIEPCHISGTFFSSLPYIRYFFVNFAIYQVLFFNLTIYQVLFFFQLCQFWFILSSSPWPTRPLHRPCFWSVQSDRSDFLRRLYFSSCLIQTDNLQV